jgi:hypothetical protein
MKFRKYIILVSILLYTIYLLIFEGFNNASQVIGIFYFYSIILCSFYYSITRFILLYRKDKLKQYLNNKNASEIFIIGSDNIITNFIYPVIFARGLFKKIENSNSPIVLLEPTKKEFEKILKNKNYKIINLIGHGRRTAFTLNKQEVIYYWNYKNFCDKKEEINLFHCSHEEGLSLIEYLSKNNKGYIKNDVFSPIFDKIK